jgi:DNA polymerase-1
MTNIPSQTEYRAAFKAQNKTEKIISADFSGQELRLLAYLSQEKNFIDAIEQGIDLHTNSASLIFGIEYGRVTKPQRTAAKSLTFGLIYGIGPKKLSENLEITYNQAKDLMTKYYRTFPQIKTLLDDLVKQARATQIAVSPLDGRQRDLKTFDWYDRKAVAHALNISKNLPFQGAGASVTKKALCNIQEKIQDKKLSAKLVNVIHDEIIVESKESCAQEMAKIVEAEMIKAFNHYAPSVKMEVEAQIEDHWVKG